VHDSRTPAVVYPALYSLKHTTCTATTRDDTTCAAPIPRSTHLRDHIAESGDGNLVRHQNIRTYEHTYNICDLCTLLSIRHNTCQKTWSANLDTRRQHSEHPRRCGKQPLEAAASAAALSGSTIPHPPRRADAANAAAATTTSP
jgi:hypothetical protein